MTKNIRINAPKLIFKEDYHDNCHDYLKKPFIDKYLAKEYTLLIKEIVEKIPLTEICDKTSKYMYIDTIVCDQHAVIFSHHKDIFPILATYALNACVGLIIYEPKLKIGCLAHIDGLPGYSKKSANEDGVQINFDPVKENIIKILLYLSSLVPNIKLYEFDFYLIGGIFDLSEIMVNDIIECLALITEKNNIFPDITYKFTFKGRNLLGPINQSRNICFDTRSGKFSYFDFIENAEVYTNNFNGKLPMNIIKAPRASEAFLDITYIPKINISKNNN